MAFARAIFKQHIPLVTSPIDITLMYSCSSGEPRTALTTVRGAEAQITCRYHTALSQRVVSHRSLITVCINSFEPTFYNRMLNKIKPFLNQFQTNLPCGDHSSVITPHNPLRPQCYRSHYYFTKTGFRFCKFNVYYHRLTQPS